MKIRLCRCSHCKASRKVKHVQRDIKAIVGGAKRRAKMEIAAGRWEHAPVAVSLGYTG